MLGGVTHKIKLTDYQRVCFVAFKITNLTVREWHNVQQKTNA